MTDPADYARTACDQLRDLLNLRKAGYESLELGLSSSAVSKRLDGNLELRQCFAILAALRIDLADFVRSVMTGFNPELYLLEKWVTGKRNQQRLYRFRQTHLRKPPRRRLARGEIRALAAGLESSRFRDPKATRCQAIEILRHPDLEPAIAGEAFGVLGVDERHRGRPTNGAYCQIQALRLAFDSPLLRARTLQRIAMLVFYNGEDRTAALEAVHRARSIYFDLRDSSGVGKTWVDEAIVHNACGAHELAGEANGEALRHLAEGDVENRCSAIQGQAVAAVLQGEIERAKRHLDEVVVPEGSLYATSGIRWLHGDLALALGQADEAADHFLAVWDACIELEFGPLEQALVLLRVAKAYHLQGNGEAARETLRQIIGLQGDLSHSTHSTALAELLGQAATGQLTGDLLEKIYRQLREGTTCRAIPPLILSR